MLLICAWGAANLDPNLREISVLLTWEYTRRILLACFKKVEKKKPKAWKHGKTYNARKYAIQTRHLSVHCPVINQDIKEVLLDSPSKNPQIVPAAHLYQQFIFMPTAQGKPPPQPPQQSPIISALPQLVLSPHLTLHDCFFPSFGASCYSFSPAVTCSADYVTSHNTPSL